MLAHSSAHKNTPDVVQTPPNGITSVTDEKIDVVNLPEHVENEDSNSTLSVNLVYTNDDEEPEIHIRTWIAYGSMMLLIFCQNMCLQGPPSVVRIGSAMGRLVENHADELYDDAALVHRSRPK